MIQIRCTKKVLDTLGINNSELCECKETKAILGNWYTNIFMLERKKTLIFMSEKTFLSFILSGVRKDNIKKLPDIFYKGLEQELKNEGVDQNKISAILNDLFHIELTKTFSRSVLGNLNDLVDMYKNMIFSYGGLNYCNLTNIIKKVNRTPQRKLDWRNSIERTFELLEKISI